MLLPCKPAELFVTTLFLAHSATSACNIHVADFRGFGRQGCYDENLGIWTIIDTDFETNECKSLVEEHVHSLELVDIRHECQLLPFARRKALQGSYKLHLALNLAAKIGKTGPKKSRIAGGLKLAFYTQEMVHRRETRSQAETLLEPLQTRNGDVVSFRGGEDLIDNLRPSRHTHVHIGIVSVRVGESGSATDVAKRRTVLTLHYPFTLARWWDNGGGRAYIARVG
ncbi:glycosyltransferase family 1 [Purpureocillium lavendulum]|uniref:Glycosyltransferase family 1 n=1 Tax=Purpureocillium lavendulum TaxID=1247861 RepID=A0AB34FL43_9HYPO|nr:glycosyltransferase family 1 [Purpureocillium lavendulum]